MRRNERKALHCFAVLSVCVIVVISIVYLFFYHNIRQYDSKIIVQGVSVGKTDVSGLTAFLFFYVLACFLDLSINRLFY